MGRTSGPGGVEECRERVAAQWRQLRGAAGRETGLRPSGPIWVAALVGVTLGLQLARLVFGSRDVSRP